MLMMIQMTGSICFGIRTICCFTMPDKPVKPIFKERPRKPAKKEKVAVPYLPGKIEFEITDN